MLLNLTKEEYKLLITLYAESFNSIILKKSFNIKVPETYTFVKYNELQMKLFKQAENQNIDLEDDEFPEDTLNELSKKIENEKISKDKILSTFMNEIIQDNHIAEELNEIVLNYRINNNTENP